MGVDAEEINRFRRVINETAGDLIIIAGSDLSAEAQAAIAASAANFAAENRRVLLHPLPLYNNSVGAVDMLAPAKSLAEVVKNSGALLIGGSLPEAEILAGLDFVVVQELFDTQTVGFADVVFPAASFAEVDGTFTNNAGNVQRVRKAIDPLNQSKPDWLITSLIAAQMGVDFGYDVSASAVFRAIADSVPAYQGLRYPHLKDESNPVQIRHSISNGGTNLDALKQRVESMPSEGEKNSQTPRVGHKLHRLTTMTSKTPQFHLLANGNPKPENLLVSPLSQFELNGHPKVVESAAAVGVGDRE
ncbi:MAG TPA: hypothetical protein DEA22_10135 [Blastocatellia bacterium]|nr:hypothetical protein [Blastocatellia bacterium]